MSHALYSPPRPQAVGEVLDSAFRLFRGTLLKCLPYGVLTMVVGQLPNIGYLATGRSVGHFGQGRVEWWLTFIAGIVGSFWLLNAMLLRQRAILQGRPAAGVSEWSEAFRRLPDVIVVFVLGCLAAALILGPVALVPASFRIWGVVLALIPLTYLSTVLPSAWPAVVLDGMGALRAVTYSFRLVSGNWWRVTAVYGAAVGIGIVFYGVPVVVVFLVASVLGTLDLAVVSSVVTVCFITLGAAAAPFMGALTIAVYGDLQSRVTHEEP